MGLFPGSSAGRSLFIHDCTTIIILILKTLYICISGLWFDMEVSYTGSFLMTLETKMNLARLGKEGEGLGEHGKEW